MLKITLKDLSEHHGTEVIIKIVVQNAGVQQQYQKWKYLAFVNSKKLPISAWGYLNTVFPTVFACSVVNSFMKLILQD